MTRSPALEVALGRLQAELGHEVYDTWFARLQVDHVEGDAWHLTLPTAWLVTWVGRHYQPRLEALLRETAPAATVHLTVRAMGRAWQPPAEEPPPATARSEAESSPATLELGMARKPFAIGDSNRMVHAAITSLARAQPSAISPLFIHGGPGLGKTHLMQIAAHLADKEGLRSTYLSAARFAIGALATSTKAGALQPLRDADIILLDDIQELRGNLVRQAFSDCVCDAIDEGRYVVLSADRPLADIDKLTARVRSRIQGGLVLALDPFDPAVTRELLTAGISRLERQHAGFHVPSPVLDLIVSRCRANGRAVEGVLHQLSVHHQSAGREMTEDVAVDLLGDLVADETAQRVKVDDIQLAVARHFNVSRLDLVSQRRTTALVKPRQIAMHLAKTMTPRSLPEIGRRFGDRDHTTVLYAVRKIEAARRIDADLNAELCQIEADLRAGARA